MNNDDITTQEAAELLGIVRASVVFAILRGRLKVVRRWGRNYVLSRADVLAYRATRRVGRPPKAKRK